MDPPGPLPPLTSPMSAPPARTAQALTRQLAQHGLTGIYTAATAKFAVISVATGLTVWTDGHQFWCTHAGQRRTWPAAEPARAAADLATLATSPPPA
jgi:hypothetical protein